MVHSVGRIIYCMFTLKPNFENKRAFIPELYSGNSTENPNMGTLSAYADKRGGEPKQWAMYGSQCDPCLSVSIRCQ